MFAFQAQSNQSNFNFFFFFSSFFHFNLWLDTIKRWWRLLHFLLHRFHRNLSLFIRLAFVSCMQILLFICKQKQLLSCFCYIMCVCVLLFKITSIGCLIRSTLQLNLIAWSVDFVLYRRSNCFNKPHLLLLLLLP